MRNYIYTYLSIDITYHNAHSFSLINVILFFLNLVMAAAIAYHDRVDSTITLDDASGLELYSNHDSSYVVVSEDNGQGRLRPVGTVYLNGKNIKAISKNMNKYDNNTPPRCSNNGINDNKSSNSSSSSPSVPHARRLSFSSNSSGGSSAPSIYECVDGAMTKLMDTFTDGTCGSTCLSWTKHPCACINM